jgi:hypothetical protein
MLALFSGFRYSNYKRKLQKQTNSKKIPKKIFLLVVANAIRYPPQHENSRFGGFFRALNSERPTWL